MRKNCSKIAATNRQLVWKPHQHEGVSVAHNAGVGGSNPPITTKNTFQEVL